MHPDQLVPKTDFERNQAKKFKAEGNAESVLCILAARMIEVTEAERQRILSEQSEGTINRWINRALTARTAANHGATMGDGKVRSEAGFYLIKPGFRARGENRWVLQDSRE